MGQRVLLLYLPKFKDSWYDLADAERKALIKKVHEISAANGGRVLVGADCHWSTAKHDFFAVEEYPSAEAVSAVLKAERDVGFSQHVEETYVVGTPWESQGNDE